MKKSFFVLILVLSIVFCALPIFASASSATYGDLEVTSEDLSGVSYSASKNQITISNPGTYRISGDGSSNNNAVKGETINIYQPGTYNITLDNCHLGSATPEGAGGLSSYNQPMLISGGATVNMKLLGTNKLYAEKYDISAITIGSNSSLIITGDSTGSLEVISRKANYEGSGQGSGIEITADSGSFIVNGGTVTANSINGSAIGHRYHNSGSGSFTVNAGKVFAYNNASSPALGTTMIKINGGNILAKLLGGSNIPILAVAPDLSGFTQTHILKASSNPTFYENGDCRPECLVEYNPSNYASYKFFNVYEEIPVAFVADGQTIATKNVAYGLPLTDIPDVPTKAGYTQTAARWNVSDFSDIRSGITVNAIYTKDPVVDTTKPDTTKITTTKVATTEVATTEVATTEVVTTDPANDEKVVNTADNSGIALWSGIMSTMTIGMGVFILYAKCKPQEVN